MGEMLDNIELNVMHTVDHVEKARDETKRAMKYQGQARKIEETRLNIDKISEHVEEAKKLYSIILSAPIPEPKLPRNPLLSPEIELT